MRNTINIIIAFIASLVCLAPAQQEPGFGDGLSIRAFGPSTLHDGDIVSLNLPAAGSDEFTITLNTLRWGSIELYLRPQSVRAEGYQLIAIGEGGRVDVLDPGIERTYSGSLRGIEGTLAAGSLLDEGFYGACWLQNDTRLTVQPLSDFIPGASADLHVVYSGADTTCTGTCAVAETGHTHTHTGGYGQRATCSGGTCVAQIAFDADFEYFTARGSSTSATQDRIAATLNVVNHQYLRDNNIVHLATSTMVRTSASDPYTSTDPNGLLVEFQNYWNNNHPLTSRDVAHLFTGKDLDGTVIGIAYIGAVCNNTIAYGLVQADFSDTFACQTDLSAHELGHNWNAQHCSCPENTMNPSITCANWTGFASGGSTIDSFANSRTCLDSVTSVPINNSCANATLITNSGTYTGTNTNATTDGGTVGCGVRGGGTNDVFWYVYAMGSGPLTVDTCGSNFDTVLSVHTRCPAGLDTQVACNDNVNTCVGGSPSGRQSSITFNASEGSLYFIRVAGASGTTGNIVLNITLPPATLNNDNCANAYTITAPSSLYHTFYQATTDGSCNCPGLGSGCNRTDRWYRYTAPCNGTLTIDTCGSGLTVGFNMGVNTALSVHSACLGTADNQVACNDNGFVCEENGVSYDAFVSMPVTAGTSYYIRVIRYVANTNSNQYYINTTFTPTSHSPLLTDIPNANITCGQVYTGPTPTAVFPGCAQGVTYSLITAPSGMTINSTTGVVSWPSPSPGGGTVTVTIRASNAQGSDDETWTLTLSRLVPIIEDIPNSSFTCPGAYTGPTPVVSNAPCANSITWSLISAPSGASVNTSTGVVSWTRAMGTHTFTLRATNSAGNDTETWTVTTNPNTPVMNDITNATGTCGVTYNGPTPTFVNPSCAGTVSFSTVVAPPGSFVNTVNGVVGWINPTPGTHTFTLRATNSAGFDDESWTFTVPVVAPTLASIANQQGVCGSLYTGPAPVVSNAACATGVTYSLITAPSGMSINTATGVVSWFPQLGTHTITIRATNSAGFTNVTFTLTIPVRAPSINPVSDSTVACTPSTYFGPVHSTTLPACMTGVTWSMVNVPPGTTINSTNGVVTYGNPSTGPHYFEVRATNSGGTATEGWTVTFSAGDIEIFGSNDATVTEGESAAFAISYTGISNGTTFRWYRDGNPLFDGAEISGAASQTLTVNNVTLADSGAGFQCALSDQCGTFFSDPGILTVNPGCPPCPADFNLDGGVDGSDVAVFFEAWSAADPCADVNLDGGIDGADVDYFFPIWSSGGC